MAQLAGADDWDGVWDEYDRQHGGPDASGTARSRGDGTVAARRARPKRLMLGAMLLLCGTVWLGLPWLLAARLAPAMESGEAAALRPHLDVAALQRSAAAELRPAPRRDHPPGTERWLDGMAADMAQAWGEPAAVAAWVRLRARPGMLPRDAAVAGLGRLRNAERSGLSAARLDYEGGVGLDVRLSGGEVQVTGVRFARP